MKWQRGDGVAALLPSLGVSSLDLGHTSRVAFFLGARASVNGLAGSDSPCFAQPRRGLRRARPQPGHSVHHPSRTGAQAHCEGPPEALTITPSRGEGGTAMIRERLDDIRFLMTLAIVAMVGSLLASLLT